jgi:hypothetical protein
MGKTTKYKWIQIQRNGKDQINTFYSIYQHPKNNVYFIFINKITIFTIMLELMVQKLEKFKFVSKLGSVLSSFKIPVTKFLGETKCHWS